MSGFTVMMEDITVGLRQDEVCKQIKKLTLYRNAAPLYQATDKTVSVYLLITL